MTPLWAWSGVRRGRGEGAGGDGEDPQVSYPTHGQTEKTENHSLSFRGGRVLLKDILVQTIPPSRLNFQTTEPLVNQIWSMSHGLQEPLLNVPAIPCERRQVPPPPPPSIGTWLFLRLVENLGVGWVAKDGNPKFYIDPYFSPLSLKGITKDSLPPGACEIFILFCAGEAQLCVMKDAGKAKHCRLTGLLPVSGCAGSQRREGKGGKGRRRRPLVTYPISTTNWAAKLLRGNSRKTRQETKEISKIPWSPIVEGSSGEEQRVSSDLVNLTVQWIEENNPSQDSEVT